MKLIIRLAVLAFAVAGVAYAADNGNGKPFNVQFGRQGVTVRDLKPGTKVAWMAMIRTPKRYHTSVRILRGFGPVTPNSTFEMALENADSTRGMWAIADVDNGAAVHAASPKMITSHRSIPMRAVPGAEKVEIDSAAVEVLYVRPHGGGAWKFAVADGGGLDADGQPNGTIVMNLSSMQSMKGNPHAPATVQKGDLIVVIDPRGFRTATLEVTQ